MAIPKTYRDAFFVCRSDGHRWAHESTETIPNNKHLVKRTLYCTGHEGFRIDVVDWMTGIVTRRRYVMPKDYYVTGIGRPTRGEFRRVLIRKELRGE